ncbi:hypothetical protein PLESTB_001794500 [Pleodorina starrii]|uniref:Peroxisomal assembly protein PEX3 n=1 Tax=Pleodorina starrii TaxID=330485 RepID=A0A9W6F9U4_9CHLO|nr:hypothetical protein PLESTM_001158800 [Pleodorina starrii]GLC61709.1 hypothetical protein PLESTB_001794500 [Pleodorina starrii]GLC69188.1 hypothetical protein PLESTF_000800100 [Pleodorina starrii]
MDFLRRRKRLILGFAAGVAGAAAAYYWWMGYRNTKLQQQRSVEMELTAFLRGAALHHGGASSGDSAAADGGGDTTDADDCGSPDLDDSLDSHFNYIQRVSAPQELSNLLPRIQATLFKLTDVSLVKQQQQAAGGGGGVQEQLRLLARLCFGRTVAAAFLLPLMDLCVRTKLNIIGRHLFLQEKFSKLRQPAAPAARMRLPPRLTAAAVEAFLTCEQLADRGCAWLAEQAMFAADRVLEGTPLNVNVTPEELADMVQAMSTCLGQAVNAAAATSPTGCAWVDTIVGPSAAPAVGGGVDAAAASGSAEAYRRALSNAAMVEELESELRRVLCNYRFGEALHAAVSQCLSTCAAHIHATFISQAAAAAAAQQQQQQQQSQEQSSPPPSQQQQQQQQGGESESRGQAGPASASVPSPAPSSGGPAQEDSAPQSSQQRQQQPQRVVSPFSAAAAQEEDTTSPEAAESASGEQEQQQQQEGEGNQAEDKKAPADAGPEPPLAPIAAPSSPQRSGGSASSGRGGSGGGGGGPSRAASLAAAAVAAMQPRPLARCLRAVQGACDPLFVDAREVSARIACLPTVMSLCAVAFAAPLEL